VRVRSSGKNTDGSIHDGSKVFTGCEQNSATNGGDAVNLADCIIVLRIFKGIPISKPIQQGANVHNDGQIGLPEAIYIMQKAAGPR